MEWFETSLPLFLLLLCRVTAFFVIAPIFSGYGVPPQFRIGLAALFTLLVAGTLQGNEGIAFDITFPLLVIQEVAIGISLGFIAMLFLTAMQVAGTVIDVQMGFILANVIDPQTGAQTPLTGSFKYLLAILVFLSLNGHHM
ncbi:flagellar biosynthetic protein FliR, partial [Klebsiella pneumoniae]